jgi:FixJ family two-component response regulator
MSSTPVVSVVDDDEQVRESLAALIQSMDVEVEAYASGREFLDHYNPGQPGCIVLDLRMPQLNGQEVIDELNARQINTPVIMISGHGDIPAAVAAIKSGAVDFLEKPYPGSALMDSVRRAIARDAEQRESSSEKQLLLERYETLTADERQVLELTVAGKPDKAIALKLDLSLRTIQLRRASVMRKMHAHSRAELIGLAHRIERGVPATS